MARNRYLNGDWIGAAIVSLIALALMGSCATTTVNCWRRGGTVIKNVFDWPTCVEVTRR